MSKHRRYGAVTLQCSWRKQHTLVLGQEHTCIWIALQLQREGWTPQPEKDLDQTSTHMPPLFYLPLSFSFSALWLMASTLSIIQGKEKEEKEKGKLICKEQPRNCLFVRGQVKDHETKEESIRKQGGLHGGGGVSHDDTLHIKGLFTFHFMACPCPGGLSVTADRNNVISEMTPHQKKVYLPLYPFLVMSGPTPSLAVHILLALPDHQDKDLCYLFTWLLLWVHCLLLRYLDSWKS